MTESNENRALNWFTPFRFGLLLALLILASFPQIVLGLETFVARDFGFFAYPLAYFQRECFWHGELPFWDPYNNCGVPFLAQWNTMPLYPPALVYLTLPLHWALSFFCLLHLWFAGLGMYFLARRWTGSNFAAAFAGTAFAFNGFTLNLLMWPSHIATFSWMPWVVLAVELAWRDGGRKIFLAAIVGAFQMLAGGPETIFLTWLITAALWLQQVIFGGGGDASSPSAIATAASEPRVAMLWRFPLVVLLVFALSAAQLLPFLDLVAHAQRETGFADLRWSMPGRGWANFLVPMAFGTTHTEGIFFQHNQYWTSSYYAGLGTLWLALAALLAIHERRIWLLGVLAAAGLVLALGENTPVLPVLRKLIPQLSFITYPIKYISVLIFAMPLLAAFGLARFPKIEKWLLPLGGVLLTLIIVILYWIKLAPLPGDNQHATLLNGVSREIFVLLTGTALFALGLKAKARFLEAAPLFLLLVAWLDVFTHEPAQNPTVAPWIYDPGLSRIKLALQPQPALGGSRAMVSPWAANEFITFATRNARDNFLAKRLGYCANCNLLDAVPKVDGFFSLTPRESYEVLSLFYQTTNADYPRLEDFLGVSQMTAPDQVFHWQARTNFLPLVTAGQKPVFLDAPAALAALTRNNFDPGKTVFLPPEARAFTTVSNQTSAKVLKCQFGDNTVVAEIEADEPSLVVVAQMYYHDWQAQIDGRAAPLLRANVAFQAVQVPAGRHWLHFYYRDHAFEIGAVVAGIAWLGSLWALLILRRKP
jgi:hypothetical protein